MSDEPRIIDLDALVPQPVTIKLNGLDIPVSPPRLSDILKLASLGQKIADSDTATPEEVENVLNQINDHIRILIPELEGKELNTAQLLKLIEIVSEMAVPPDAKELKARGISPTGPKANPSD